MLHGVGSWDLLPSPPALTASNQPTIWERIWTRRLKFPGSTGSEDVGDSLLCFSLLLLLLNLTR